jgi:Flp pilus assembly protein TadD
MAAGPSHPRSKDPKMPGGGTDRGEALRQAAFALNAKRPRDAQRIVEEILKHDPQLAGARHILGLALLMQGRAEAAIEPLEAAARGRHDPELETQLALALSQAGRREEALSRLKRAIKRQPAYPPAFHGLGTLLFAIERCDEAIEVLSRGVEVAPMMPEMSILLGSVLLKQRNYEKAKAAFRQALAISPASPEALSGMGAAFYATGDNGVAADFFRRCLRSRPDDDTVWLQLGHCLLRLGDHDAGYECFRTAARGDAKRYGRALSSLAASGRGRAWLRPSVAARFMRRPES